MRPLVPLLLAALVVAALPTVAGQEAVAVFVEAPQAAATGRTLPVNITVAGGPAAVDEEGLFIVNVYLRGENLAGASPLEDSPTERASRTGTFAINVTMPVEEGRVELVVEANSTREGVFRTATATRFIEVLVPVQVSAVVENTGSVEVRDARAYLLVNGERVAETTIDRLRPGETRTVEFEWLPVGLEPGTHVLEVWVDLNHDGEVDPALGEVVLRQTFHKAAEPLNPLFLILGAVAAFVAALLVGAYLRRRREGG